MHHKPLIKSATAWGALIMFIPPLLSILSNIYPNLSRIIPSQSVADLLKASTELVGFTTVLHGRYRAHARIKGVVSLK